MSDDARGPWGGLAAKPPRCELDLAGAELLSESTHLDEVEPGRMTWSIERIYRSAPGLLLATRHTRSTGDDAERLELLAAPTPDDLVAEIRTRWQMTPGLVEVLGRAGIEIGLEPGDEIED